MTKKVWSSIHGKVKEAESMKSHCDGEGSRMEQNKEGEKLLPLSLALLIIYIHIYIYIYIYAL